MTWSLARPGIDMGLKAESRTEHSAAGDNSPAVDAVLLEQVSAGDEAAFGEIAGRHYAVVFRVASRVLADAAEAEDVTQEAFVRLVARSGRGQQPGSTSQLAHSGRRNLAIDRIRRTRPSTPDGLEEMPDGATAPDGRLRHGQAADAVADAMAKLPERQRTALHLTYFEGLGNQQTGQIMQISVEAVESLLSRARRTLRETLSPVWGDLIEELEQLK
jgi:RNA polymerase sigma-70 factor (ECF subfamily)